MYKDKQKLHNFFLVPGRGPALLGMLDIETLDPLSMNCNEIAKPEEEAD